MSSEHRNRTNKAQAIAAALVTVGVTANEAANKLPPATWRLAALTGWHIAKAEGVESISATPWTTISDATWLEVIRLLAADEARRAEDAEGLTAHRTDDVFASIAAGSALPRPAQDPDAPIPAAGEAAPCGDCGHDAGYHDSLLTTGEIVGPCYHDGCGCTAWAATARPSTAEWLAGINYGATTTEGWD